jgi:hypothetical protein
VTVLHLDSLGSTGLQSKTAFAFSYEYISKGGLRNLAASRFVILARIQEVCCPLASFHYLFIFQDSSIIHVGKDENNANMHFLIELFPPSCFAGIEWYCDSRRSRSQR